MQILPAMHALAEHHPAVYKELIADPTIYMDGAIDMHATISGNSRTEIVFKPRPVGGFQACYLIADLNYASEMYICSLIINPTTRANCEKAAKIAYCEAFDLCGDPA